MENQTKIIFNGTLFEIDPHREAFIQEENPSNIISFSYLQRDGGFYVLNYNLQNCKASDHQNQDKQSIAWQKLVIQEELLKPNFVAEDDFTRLHNEISYKHGWNTLLIDKVIRERLAGKLPEINIAGDKWEIDLFRNEIRLMDDPRVFISNVKTILYEQTCLFDHRKKSVASIRDDLHSCIDNLVFLHFPPPIEIDPIGTAKLNGLPPTARLGYFQQKHIHTLKTSPFKGNLLAPAMLELSLKVRAMDALCSKPGTIISKPKRNGNKLK